MLSVRPEMIVTVLIVVTVATGMAIVPDVLAMVEAIHLAQELAMQAREHAPTAAARACTRVALACGVA